MRLLRVAAACLCVWVSVASPQEDTSLDPTDEVRDTEEILEKIEWEVFLHDFEIALLSAAVQYLTEDADCEANSPTSNTTLGLLLERQKQLDDATSHLWKTRPKPEFTEKEKAMLWEAGLIPKTSRDLEAIFLSRNKPQ